MITIRKEKAFGHLAITLVGFPSHDNPYGFDGTKKFNVTMLDGKFYKCNMALPLYDGTLDGIIEKIKFGECLCPDETENELYDLPFMPMENSFFLAKKNSNLLSEN